MAQVTLSEVKGLFAQIYDVLGGSNGSYWYDTISSVLRGEMPDSIPSRDGLSSLGRAVPGVQYLDELKRRVVELIRQDAYDIDKLDALRALNQGGFGGMTRRNTAVLAVSPVALGMCGRPTLQQFLETAVRNGLELLPLEVSLWFLLQEQNRQAPRERLFLFCHGYSKYRESMLLLRVDSSVTDLSPPDTRHPATLRYTLCGGPLGSQIDLMDTFLMMRK